MAPLFWCRPLGCGTSGNTCAERDGWGGRGGSWLDAGACSHITKAAWDGGWRLRSGSAPTSCPAEGHSGNGQAGPVWTGGHTDTHADQGRQPGREGVGCLSRDGICMVTHLHSLQTHTHTHLNADPKAGHTQPCVQPPCAGLRGASLLPCTSHLPPNAQTWPTVAYTPPELLAPALHQNPRPVSHPRTHAGVGSSPFADTSAGEVSNRPRPRSQASLNGSCRPGHSSLKPKFPRAQGIRQATRTNTGLCCV